MRVGSLFAGIGGFDLAARWMGWETAWFSEIDPYASAVVAKHWPGVPNHGDITQIDFTQVEPVDLLCGGFPCQDISNAGKRAGIDGERSGLWGEYARAIGELRPRYVVVENVAALLGRGLERILGDLAALGYDAEWKVFSAADVDAPHLRERLWITAYADGQQHEGRPDANERQATAHLLAHTQRDGLEGHRATRGTPHHRGRRPAVQGGTLADTSSGGLEEQRLSAEGRGLVADLAGRGGLCQDAGVTGYWWATEPDVGRVAHGVPHRVDRLKCLGNAIVPQCALVIFQAIQAREESMGAVA
jgi:DNA (cytosine-5)-methyltransferase 1